MNGWSAGRTTGSVLVSNTRCSTARTTRGPAVASNVGCSIAGPGPQRGAPAPKLDRLDRWHFGEEPPPAPAPVDERDPGRHECRPDDQRGPDRFLEDQGAEHDADDRQEVGHERGPSRPPLRQQPEVGEVRRPRPEDAKPDHREPRLGIGPGGLPGPLQYEGEDAD